MNAHNHVASGIATGDPFNILILVLYVVTLLVGIYFGFAIIIARIHDFGKSGWLTVLGLVPYVGSLFSIILLFVPGDKKKNKFGAPQK